jgi:hypothetical protein
MIGPRVAYSPNKAFQAAIKRVFCRSTCVLATRGPRMTAHVVNCFINRSSVMSPRWKAPKGAKKRHSVRRSAVCSSSLKCWWWGISKRFRAGTWHAVPFAEIDETAVLSARQRQLADENRRSGEADGGAEPNWRQRRNQRSGNCHATQCVPGSRTRAPGQLARPVRMGRGHDVYLLMTRVVVTRFLVLVSETGTPRNRAI